MSTSLINDVVSGFRLHEQHKNLELVVELDPRVPTMMKGDIKILMKQRMRLRIDLMKLRILLMRLRKSSPESMPRS